MTEEGVKGVSKKLDYKYFVLLVTMTAVVIALPFSASASGMGKMDSIRCKVPIGSWQATIDGIGQAMYSFLPGGVVIESDNNALDPNFGKMGFSNGHGLWKMGEFDAATGASTIDFTYIKYGYTDQWQLAMIIQAQDTMSMVDCDNYEGIITMGQMGDLAITAERITIPSTEE